MKRVFQVLCILGLVAGPVLFRLNDEGTFVVDGALLVVLAGLLPRTERRLPALALAACWVFLCVFEAGMATGRQAMGEEPIPYDGIQLVRHLAVLSSDLHGPGVVVGVAAGVAVFGALALALSTWVFGRLLREEDRLGVVVPAALCLGFLVVAPPTSATVGAARGSMASAELLRRVTGLRSSTAHDAFMAMRLERRPDVRIYILESYGMTAFRGKEARRWQQQLFESGARLSRSGWSLGTVRSRAPTSGGRSWICDAAMLSGRPIRFQAEYEAFTADTDALDALPEWFASNGYETILSRPSDRERPGVKLQNRFDFERTVFFDDLDYPGRPLGWGHIPDRYAVSWLEENVFADADRPQFSFTHLSTSHYPWRARRYPKAVGWRDFKKSKTPKGAFEAEEPDLWRRFWLAARAFRRDPNQRSRHLEDDARTHYLTALQYGLHGIVDQLATIPADRPTLVFILGDHQPPFLAPRGAFQVPIHVAANDPALLAPFTRSGARPGWSPLGSEVIDHAGFYSWLLRGLGSYDGQTELPADLPDGVAL